MGYMDKRDYLAEENIKKTKQRTILLEILEEVNAPLTASQIHELYRQKDPCAWLSTTYRTLEMFTRHSIINKFISQENSTALYELNRHEHRHYAVCKDCHKMWDIDECPMRDVKVDTKDGDFHVTGHSLEVYGYCSNCYKKH
jgi:Fur family transcriptional regulator, ferric uptake regulator